MSELPSQVAQRRSVEKFRVRRRDGMRKAIHEWIRDDIGIAAKMAIMPEHVDKLIARLTEE